MTVAEIHRRAARVLGWEEWDCQSFSLPTLRELVRPIDPELTRIIAEVVEREEHILVPRVPKRR